MMRNRVIALVASTALLVSMVTGCSSSASTAQSPSTTAVNTSAASSPASVQPTAPIKYTIMMNQAIAEYPPDGGEAKKEILKKLEKDLGITNVDYEVILVGGSDYNTKLNAMLSGGEAPDFFQISIENLQSLVDNKVIAPLDEYIAQMPVYQDIIKNDPSAASTLKNYSVNGKIYGFSVANSRPGFNSSPTYEGLILRSDWLNKLGISEPKTIDELHKVLTAFTFNDPDGNGQNDTYGFGGDKGKMFKSIFGAHGAYMNGINSWMERDGQLVHSTTLPETKQTLQVLQQWYKEGIIDPDMFIVEGKQSKDKFIAGKFGAWEQSVWWANDARVAWSTSNNTAECKVIAPPTGPDGKMGMSMTAVRGNARAISQNCVDNKNPETLIKILDWMQDDSENGGLKLIQFGIEGVNYTYDKESNFVDQSMIKDYVELYRLGYSNPVRWIGVDDQRWIPKDDPRAADISICANQANWLQSKFYGSVPALKDYPDLYSKLWAEYFTKIVTGALSIDAFDEYVAKFEKQGGQELTQQVNAAWAATK